MNFVFGFDGGGTSCRAAIADLSGRIVGRGQSGAANTLSDTQAAVQNILQAAQQAVRMADLDASVIAESPAFLGLAGWNVGAADGDLLSRLPFSRCMIEDDAGIALQGALGDGDGVVAILGTGSVYLGRHGEENIHKGGWGFVAGDQGSGAWLGRALLSETLLAFDGVTPSSPLTQAVLELFDGDPAIIVRHAQSEKPGWFAQLAPRVFEYAERADPVAQRLLGEAIGHVERGLDAILWPQCQRLALLGGVSRFFRPVLADRFQSILVEPAGNALDGAVQLALRHFDPQWRKSA